MPSDYAPVSNRERQAMSEDPLMTLLDEFKALSPADRSAIERQLTVSERKRLRRTLVRSAAPQSDASYSPRIDVSHYSAPLAKHLLRVLALENGAPHSITAATRDTLLVLLKGGRM